MTKLVVFTSFSLRPAVRFLRCVSRLAERALAAVVSSTKATPALAEAGERQP